MLINKETYQPLSFSSLKAFSESPLAFINYKVGPRTESPAMLAGTMIHRAILEPEVYDLTTCVWRDGRRGTTAHRDFVEDHLGQEVLTPKEDERYRTAAKIVRTHPLADELLEHLTHAEEKVEFEHMGLKHRGIIDGRGQGYIMDLKTTNDVSMRSFTNTVWSFKYYMQAAIYMHAARLHAYDVSNYYIIAMQSAAPFQVVVYKIDQNYIDRGHLLWESLLEEYHAWDGKAQHPGYQDYDYSVMRTPTWAPSLDIDWSKKEV